MPMMSATRTVASLGGATIARELCGSLCAFKTSDPPALLAFCHWQGIDMDRMGSAALLAPAQKPSAMPFNGFYVRAQPLGFGIFPLKRVVQTYYFGAVCPAEE